MNDLTTRWPRRWPLVLLALPAGVATWSGWVGLGELTGFGPVKPLPGIADNVTINSAITLPIGVECYAAFALSAWLTTAPVSETTRKFGRVSALGALALGMLGQVAYHLLVSAGRHHAPWWITTLVSCLPVLVLGLGAGLSHMLHRDRAAYRPESNSVPAGHSFAAARPADSAERVPAGQITWTGIDRGDVPDVSDVAEDATPDATGERATGTDGTDETDPDGTPDGTGPGGGAPDATPPAINGTPSVSPALLPPDAATAQTLALNSYSSHAARVRAALGELGPDAGPAEVRTWLGERGQEIHPNTIRSAMRRARPVPATPVLSIVREQEVTP